MKPRVRCSSLDRLLNCPGSRTIEGIFPRWDSGGGLEGTMLHWDIAWRLVKEMGAEQPAGGIQWPSEAPKGYQTPQYVGWIVDWSFNIVRDTVPKEWALEVENELEWEFDRFILTGHEDVAATSPDGKHGKDKDWKTGRIPVLPAELNWQVAGYAALRRLIYGLESLEVEVCQPWNDEDDGYARRSSVTLDLEMLDANARGIEQRVNEALDQVLLLEIGHSQCKYCVGLKCPAIQAEIEEMKLILTPEMLAGLRSGDQDAKLVDLVHRARMLTKPIEDCQDMLKERLAAVGTITGESGVSVKIKEENAGFNVTNASGMFAWLASQMTPEQMAPALSYPGGKIKRALSKALKIPETGKAAITAESLFAGGAAPFIEPKTRKMLLFQ